MARPLRIQEPGMWHHVMNRGVRGSSIVEDDDDREQFFELLAECGERFGVGTAAACLMDTHYHLFVHDETGRLGRALRHLNGVYTQAFNRRHGREGALFRGRYRSRLVDQETYLLEVVRYIHANPVEAGLVERAGDHRWSSHRLYVQDETAPWLRKDLLASYLGDRPERRAWFDRYVHERAKPAVRDAVAPSRWSPILGSDEFVDAVRARLRAEGTDGDRERPEAGRLAAPTPDEVLATASRVFDVPRPRLVEGRRGTLNVPRLVTLLMCRDRTPARAEQLAAIFGIRRPTVSVLAAKARGLVRDDEGAARMWRELEDALARTD